MLEAIIENAFVRKLARTLPRSPAVLNDLQESDAEILRFSGTPGLIALTANSLTEVLALNLTDDPFLLGWMVVVANANDLAAVGADPVGILVQETFPHRTEEKWIDAVQAGIREACAIAQLPVLGKRASLGSKLELSGCALGTFPHGKPLLAKGGHPSDHLFASGPLGRGNAVALTRLRFHHHESAVAYKPSSRIPEAQVLREFATACSVSKRGALATLDQLARINSVGFLIDGPEEDLVDPEVMRFCKAKRLPSWIMLAGPHGDQELLFTIPPGKIVAFLEKASLAGWHPRRLGRVVPEPGVHTLRSGKSVTLDTARLRNLFSELHQDWRGYLDVILKMANCSLS